MKSSFSINRGAAVLCCLVLLLGSLCFGAAAQTVRSYTVYLDEPQSSSASNMPVVLTNLQLGTSPELTLAGWIKTDLVMHSYEYTLDGKTWVRLHDAVISRRDTEKHCPDTWQTAGFRITIDLSDLARGSYDIFVRGYTDQGDVINVLALLDTSVGLTDTETLAYREINLAAFGATDGTLTLDANTLYPIGAHDLRDFKRLEVTLDQNTPLTLASADRDAAVAFSITQEKAEQDGQQGFVAKLSLDGQTYAGELCIKTASDAHVTSIRLFYNTPDYYTDALKIHMTVTPFEYLSGANAAEGQVMVDQTVGTYIKLHPTSDTNDPFIYFNMSSYLKQNMGVQLNADHYPYAVVTAKSPATNSDGHFRLFLCAGAIRGPSADSHVAFAPINDGEWHTYVVPLCEEENWTGTVYGMRFDFIDGYAKPTDYTNIASIGLYPDLESAQAAADAPLEVYHEQGKIPENKYEEEGRAPSGKADAITWFDQSMLPCFGGENKTAVSFDEYGHLILSATEATNDPYVSFDMQTYASLNGTQLLMAKDYQTIVLRVLADENIYGKNFILYYYAGGYNYAEGTRTAIGQYEGGDWEYIVYDMKSEPYWTDQILGMRLDYSGQISSGQRVYVSDILFFADTAAWQEYADANGIPIEGGATYEPITQAPETERPTIEIPTQGPGLEFVPSEGKVGLDAQSGCKSVMLASSALILLICCACVMQKSVTDMKQYFTVFLLILLACCLACMLAACVPDEPDVQDPTQTDADSTGVTEQITQTEQTTAEPATEQVTDGQTTDGQSTTESTAPREDTTFGPLHFPEDTGE